MNNFAVLGSGGWGTSIAIHLAKRAGRSISLWCAHETTATILNKERCNARQLPGEMIPDSINITATEEEAIAHTECWVVAVPTVHLRAVLSRFRGLASSNLLVVSLTKGIEHDTFRRPSEIIREVLGIEAIVALSGPSHAEEVCRGMPTSLVAASHQASSAEVVQADFGEPHFRIYTNQDIIGVELAGALKNVIGIAAGICDGLGFGDNAKAALLTRGLHEMKRFGTAYGAASDTFTGMAALGDLITTCFSKHGRNRRIGEELARGVTTLEEILARPQVAEGIYTVKSVVDRVQNSGIEMPIASGVFSVLYQGKSPKSAVQELLARTSGDERGF